MTIKLGGFIAHAKIFRLRFVTSSDYIILRIDVIVFEQSPSLDVPSGFYDSYKTLENHQK